MEGRFSTARDELAAVSCDFGNLIHRRPGAVLHPAGPADVAAVVRHGAARGLPVVARGAGHSVDGQALVEGGIVVNLPALAGVGRPGTDHIDVSAGASWAAVLDATLPAGLAPPVLPDYLPLTVGGTVAAGGLGGASHRHGAVADHVHELDVVTLAGAVVTCSPARAADLFDAVRGTQGEHGIIVRVRLGLTPAPALARRYLLGYTDLAAFLADQARLAYDRRFDHVGGQVEPAPDGGWRYLLDAVATHTPPGPAPDDRALLADLRHDRGAAPVTLTYQEFLHRLDPLVAGLRATGSWADDPHPRCNVLLPGRRAGAIVADVLADLTAGDLGPGGGILLYPVPTRRLAAPHLPRPDDELTVVFGLQRTGTPDDPARLARQRRGNAALRERARAAGGTTYSQPGPFHDARDRAARRYSQLRTPD